MNYLIALNFLVIIFVLYSHVTNRYLSSENLRLLIELTEKALAHADKTNQNVAEVAKNREAINQLILLLKKK